MSGALQVSMSGAPRAQLPAVYEAAKSALAKCSQIDECEQWKDKAAALASYARQANDTALLEYASRIKNRAVRRLGELSRQQEKVPGSRTDLPEPLPDAGKRLKSEVLAAAGISTSAANRAELVSHIPEDEFDRLVDGPSPPTVTQLAELGSQRKRESEQRPPRSGMPPAVVDTEARKALAQLVAFADFCRKQDPRSLAQRIPEDRARDARLAVSTLDAWLDSFVTNLR